jgi:hypothetical protein
MMESNRILLPDTPAVAGLSFRNPFGEQDAEALVAVHAGRAERDAVDPLSSLESFPTRARDLYASLGFRVVKAFLRYRKSPG